MKEEGRENKMKDLKKMKTIENEKGIDEDRPVSREEI
jgi:hypothetical protein